jgi:hypothetical protein
MKKAPRRTRRTPAPAGLAAAFKLIQLDGYTSSAPLAVGAYATLVSLGAP